MPKSAGLQMAKQDKEEVIFEFKIDQGDAISEAEKFKKLIIQTREEQTALNKAYKAGNISLEEFAKEGTRLDQVFKSHTTAYSKLTHQIQGTKSWTDKLKDSLKQSSQQINVAGVNVGGLTSKLTTFINPATAAVGVVTGLTAAYASSAVGARDLSIATDTLASSFKFALNNYGEFVDELGRTKDKGIFENLSFQISRVIFGEGSANKARAVALANEQIRLLEISGQFAKGFAKDREREAENLRRIRDDETKTAIERLQATEKITEKLGNSEQLRTTVLLAQVEAIKDASTNYKLDYEAQLRVAEKEAEIKDIQEEINGKLQENLNAREAITAQLNEQQRIEARIAGIDLSARPIGTVAGATDRKKKADSSIVEGTLATVDSEKAAAAALAEIQDGIQKNNAKTAKSYAEKAAAAVTAAEREVQAQEGLQMVLSQLSSIFGENTAAYKIIASSEALMNTYKGANLALGTYPPPLSFALAGATILAGLANVTAINKAAGGGDFITKGPSMLLVGDNPGGVERVTVEPLSGKGKTQIYNPNLIAMAGGGSLLAGDPGGLNTNSMTAETNQNIATANMLKKMMKGAPIQVAVRDITTAQTRVKVTQSLARTRK